MVCRVVTWNAEGGAQAPARDADEAAATERRMPPNFILVGVFGEEKVLWVVTLVATRKQRQSDVSVARFVVAGEIFRKITSRLVVVATCRL